MKKRYKHKKTGDIAEYDYELYTINKNKEYQEEYIPIRFVKNSSDWEEIVEKNYEILSFISNSKTIYYLQKSGRFYANDTLMEKEVFLEEIINTEGYKIYSVKRLSDDEIFTIGDKVDINGKFLKIIIEEFCFIDNCLYVQGKNAKYLFNIITKIKQPLFITEDGVEIFEGDSYYWVTELYNHVVGRESFKINFLKKATLNDNTQFDLKFKVHNFSTKEKVEEYILINKPCLSYKDIISINQSDDEDAEYVDFTKNDLKELVK